MPSAKRAGKGFGLFLILAFFVVFAAFPFFWMIITAFKADRDLYNPKNTPFLFSKAPTLHNLDLLLSHTLFKTFVLNSVIVGVGVVLITLVLALPAAYALARMPGRLGEHLGIGIFLTYLIPPTLLFIPLSRVVADLGLQDSLWSLIVVYPTFTVPFCTWLLMGFFKSIPRDIEEQAMVDGYSRMGALVRTVIPLSLPGILTVVIFAFALTTHEFIYALAFVSVSAHKTISVGVPTELVRGDVFYWQSLMAAAAIVAVPVALVYNLFLDRFVAGFTMGAVKG